MNKLYKAGEGVTHSVRTPQDAKSLGFITRQGVHDWVVLLVCDTKYPDGGQQKAANIIREIENIVDKIQIGEGKSCRYYYNFKEMMNYLDELNSKEGKEMNTQTSSVDTIPVGYISGMLVGKQLFNYLNTSNFNFGSYFNSVYRKQFDLLRTSGAVRVKKVPNPNTKGVRYYYCASDVTKYISSITSIDALLPKN